MHNKYKMATNHVVEEVEEPLEDVTDDYFVYKGDVEVNEESDYNGAVDDETTTEGTHECDGGSSGTSLSATSDVMAVTEFLSLEKAKSIVWNYFGFPARSGKFRQKDKRLRKEIYCKLCSQSLSYKDNMTNMIVHLQSCHSAVYSDRVDQLKTTGSAHLSVPLSKDQLSIEHSSKTLTPMSRSSSRWKALSNSVCYFLAKDLHPLSQ